MEAATDTPSATSRVAVCDQSSSEPPHDHGPEIESAIIAILDFTIVRYLRRLRGHQSNLEV
jgi:hypothetical protein